MVRIQAYHNELLKAITNFSYVCWWALNYISFMKFICQRSLNLLYHLYL